MATQSGTPPRYRVDSQLATVGIGPDGKAARGIEISFTTERGNKGTVFVTRESYSVDRAREQIEAHVRDLDAVSALGNLPS